MKIMFFIEIPQHFAKIKHISTERQRDRETERQTVLPASREGVQQKRPWNSYPRLYGES